MKRKALDEGGFEYFQNGENPRLMIHSGTHGDEFEIIDLVSECVEKYEERLPELIYVPMVSPSAVAKKQRENSLGNDVNRIFYSESKDLEVQQNIKIFNQGPVELLISFHEDPESKEYYIYDSDFKLGETDLVIKHNQYLQDMGISLLNGLDDSNDPDLGYEFKNGYRKFTHDKGEPDNGMILVWAFNHGMINHCLLPEIPGKADLKRKKFLVDSFFERVLVPYFY